MVDLSKYSDADIKELERIKLQREQEFLASEDARYGFWWSGGACKKFRGNIAKKLLEFELTSQRNGNFVQRFRLVTVEEWDDLNKRLAALEAKKDKVK